MANISNKAIIDVLVKENRWMTFEELIDAVPYEYDSMKFFERLTRLAEQGKIQYIPAQSMDRAWYGSIELVKDW